MLAPLLMAAAYTRTTNISGVFRDGEVFLIGLDSHFHMRRVELTLADFPRVPHFDAYANVPEGAQIDWPLGFDLVLATLCRLITWLSGGAIGTEAIAAMFNPALGVGVCVVAFLLGKQLLGPSAGLVAAGIAAVLPILTGYSNVGRVDHHAAEPFVVAVPLLLFLWASQDAEGEITPQLRRRRAYWAGASLALSIGVWPGSIVVSGIAFLSLAAPALWRSKAPTQLCHIGHDAFAAATIVMLPLRSLHPWLAHHNFGYYAPSWFQPLCFLVAWATFEALLRVRTAPRLRRAAITFAVPIAFWALAFVALEPLRDSIAAAAGYVGRGEAQISQVHESRPLLSFGLAHLYEHYTALIYVFAALLLVVWQRRRSLRFRLFFVWLGCTAVLAVAQLRLGSIFAPLWCVAWGIALRDGYTFVAARTKLPVAIAAAVTAALVIVVPVAPQYARAEFSGTEEFVQSYGALRWLRQHAASPGDIMQPSAPPAFAVMSRWQWGHWVTQVGRQANVANPLGQTQANLRGVHDSVRFYLSREPSQAIDMLESRHARYVLVTPVLHELAGMVRHSGDELSTFIGPQSEGSLAQLAFFETMNARLLHFDARRVKLDGKIYPPLRRFRLVFESHTRAQEVGMPGAYAKLFELVAGAELVGRSAPGSAVKLRLVLRTNIGRELIYRDQVTAGDDGTFRLRAPYATDVSGGVSARDVYHLTVDDREIGTAEVSDLAVTAGDSVAVTP
jgi:asparagine N-glycosylation enzyme membrane subunit Stt3